MVFFAPVIVKDMKKNLDITNLRFNKPIGSVSSDFVKLRFQCILFCGISCDSVPLSKFKHCESMTIDVFPPILRDSNYLASDFIHCIQVHVLSPRFS